MDKELDSSYLPMEWLDDDRMRILMTSMPPKSDVTPFNGRVNFWSSAIHSWMKTSKKLTFIFPDVQDAFRRGTVVPLCLADVIQEMLRRGDIAYLEDYSKIDKHDGSWAGWSRRVLSAPTRWTWSKLQETVGHKGIASSMLVNVKLLQEMSDSLLQHWWQEIPLCESGKAFSVQKFYYNLTTKFKISLDDLNILLHHLAKMQKVALVVHQNTTFIKFLKPGSLEVPTISESEIAEFRMKETEDLLKERLSSLQAKSDGLRNEAKHLLGQGYKKEALSVLKTKQRLAKSVEGTISMLENVRMLLEELQQTLLNVEIVSVYKVGLGALKGSLSASADDASDTMEAVQEALDECNDLTDQLVIGSTSEFTDDQALEDELAELLSSASLHENMEEHNLPDVPTENPLSAGISYPKKAMETP